MTSPASNEPEDGRSIGLLTPLAFPVFRRFWFASLLSSFGLLVQGVGASWEMSRLTGSANMVAAVQSSLMLPITLIAVPAGALADMIDKRKAGLAGVTVSIIGASSLVAAAFGHFLTPSTLLGFCFLVGAGNALYSPAWQASSAEQVSSDKLPQAIALNSISYNIARSIGPAIGGLIVAAAGAIGAFIANVVLYVPLIVTLLLWRRATTPPRLPSERMLRAISAGVRYVVHSPSLRSVMIRNFLNGLSGSSLIALLPLVARDLMGGGARTFGLLLGAFGVGAVLGAGLLPRFRRRFTGQEILSAAAIVMACAFVIIALQLADVLTGVAMVVAGTGWMIMAAVCSIVVQLSSPRWLAGRAVATYQSSIAGGAAIGSCIWGHVAESGGLRLALITSAAALASTTLLNKRWPIPTPPAAEPSVLLLEKLPVAMDLTGRSGPIVIELEYNVLPENARAFYRAMQDLQSARCRIGAYEWSISRDISDPRVWIERFHLPTWADYMRHRSRHTEVEGELINAAKAFQIESPVKARRLLERPFGSVRWRDDVADRGT